MPNPQMKSSRLKRRAYALVGVVVVVLAALAGLAFYLQQVAPFRTAVIVVDDVSIRMRYFLKRVRAAGGDSMSTLNTLITEEIIRQVAPKPPYDIAVDNNAVDRFLMAQARGKSDSISEAEYKEWCRQQLNETGFSDKEFREIARSRLLADGLRSYLADRVQTVAEQVFLHFMTVDSGEKAAKAKSRLDGGEAFAKVARELSAGEFQRNGGEIGWVPRSALQPAVARVAFGALKIGVSSQPIQLDGENMGLLMVSDRVASKEIDPKLRDAVRANVLDKWFEEEQGRHHVEIHGFHGGYDSRTDVWVSSQLRKMGK